MVIKQIRVKNFRLLKDFVIDLQPDLSLIVGKNNVGKTSLLKVLNRFIGVGDGSKFQFNDFSIEFRDKIKSLLEGDAIQEDSYSAEGISLRIIICYDQGDDLEYISPIIMTLDEDNFYVALGFDYTIGYTDYLQMRADYAAFKTNEANKKAKVESYKERNWQSFLEPICSKYFKVIKKTISVDKNGNIDEENYIKLNDIANFKLENLISFKYIDARRLVDNAESDKTLSNQTSQLYDIIEVDGSKQTTIDNLIGNLMNMDETLSNLYEELFLDISEKIKDFGGMAPNDTKISVLSTLSHKNLINGNTTVQYEQDGKKLPENYNGLGYMNLLSMIFQIEYIRKQFVRPLSKKPADINLLFIEEPEAHTHPQMQYIFIKNIKKLLKEGVINKYGIKRPLQYIISTHSSHIVADCDFEDIKYMLTSNNGYSIVKNISDLFNAYQDDTKGFAFLKQYLTINRSELFFADKAIMIEGDTERILLPAMMKKIDEDNPIPEGSKERKLLSQNISVIEAGAYSQVFTPFLNFIELKKICVITDIDVCHNVTKVIGGKNKNVIEACRWSESELDSLVTSNASIKYYLNGIKDIKILDSLFEDDKILLYDPASKKYGKSSNGNLRLCFQVKECDYHARSFEDCFMKLNQSFFKDPDNTFQGLKKSYIEAYREEENPIDEFELANKGINSKATLAIDILYLSKSDEQHSYQGWNVPTYIKDGLLWLRKD